MGEYICAFGSCAPAFVVNVWFDGLTAVGAGLAVAVAWHELQSARRENAVRATFAELDHEATAEWRARAQAWANFARAHDNDATKIAEALAAEGWGGPNVRDAVTIADRREFVAILLRYGGGDLETYLRWAASNVMNDWELMRDFVCKIRHEPENCEAYQDFEWLAGEARKRKSRDA
jgi:hypothetical protein